MRDVVQKKVKPLDPKVVRPEQQAFLFLKYLEAVQLLKEPPRDADDSALHMNKALANCHPRLAGDNNKLARDMLDELGTGSWCLW